MEYRDQLIESVNGLNQMQFDLFTLLVNVGMYGEYRHLNEMFENGESINFDDDMFKDCKDINVQMLHQLLQEIKLVRERMININAIQGTELDGE